MEAKEIEVLLQRYFEGESSLEEDRALEEYFSGGEVAPEFLEYTEFFGGLNELAQNRSETGIEEEIMDFILEQENKEKNRYRGLWKTVTGIAASVIIILGSLLIYEQKQNTFKDTYTDPNEAYMQATKTLRYISGKYNSWVAQLSKTKQFNQAFAELRKVEVINQAPKPLSAGLKAVRKGFNETNNLQKYDQFTKNE
jgi:hypothetical protein